MNFGKGSSLFLIIDFIHQLFVGEEKKRKEKNKNKQLIFSAIIKLS
jgi:hypothetical protein